MKTILAAGILAGSMVATAMAEDDRRPERERPSADSQDERVRPIRPERPDRSPFERPPFDNQMEMFKRMDTNRDGKISKEEFFASPRMANLPEEKRDAIFARLDTDGDGIIGTDEIRKMRHDAERRAKEEFRELDTDNSGGLNFEEFSKGKFFGRLPEERRRQIFARMDTDGSGEINADDKPSGPPRRPEGKRERKR